MERTYQVKGRFQKHLSPKCPSKESRLQAAKCSISGTFRRWPLLAEASLLINYMQPDGEYTQHLPHAHIILFDCTCLSFDVLCERLLLLLLAHKVPT